MYESVPPETTCYPQLRMDEELVASLDEVPMGIAPDAVQLVPTPLQKNEAYNDSYDILKQVHGGRMGHFGHVKHGYT
jgi:hypothetical protein